MSVVSQDQIAAREIETAAAAARNRLGGEFALEDVLAELPTVTASDRQVLVERARRLLEADANLFWDVDGNRFVGREELFANAALVITPDDTEIDNGILIPGHRFAAFLSPDVFPSEVVLIDGESEGRSALPRRVYSGSLAALFPYHMLLGSEQVFDFFIAEDSGNRKVISREGRTGKSELALHVFDMSRFYDRHSFTEGDALVCSVVDWKSGVVECRYLSGEERRSRAVGEWCGRFADALEQVIDRFDKYFDIPEQLAWSFFTDRTLLCNAAEAASLDEFIRKTGRIEIAYDGDHTSLVRRCSGFSDADDVVAVPEGVSISRGSTDSLDDLLTEAGFEITPVEIDSFILDCCFYRELDYADFFARCFGRELQSFADAAQEAFFHNYVEERWEDLTGAYDRSSDEAKAPLRSSVLELVERKLAFLQTLRSSPQAAVRIPEGSMRRLTEIGRYLDEQLHLINAEEYMPSQEEIESMGDALAEAGDSLNDLLDSLEIYLA